MQKRVSSSLEDESASIRQILDAGISLDGDNLPRFDRYALGRAYIPVFGAGFALARSANFGGGVERDPGWRPKTRSSGGICDPGNAALARAPQWHSLADGDDDLGS